jgi:hypothetical protein
MCYCTTVIRGKIKSVGSLETQFLGKTRVGLPEKYTSIIPYISNELTKLKFVNVCHVFRVNSRHSFPYFEKTLNRPPFVNMASNGTDAGPFLGRI